MNQPKEYIKLFKYGMPGQIYSSSIEELKGFYFEKHTAPLDVPSVQGNIIYGCHSDIKRILTGLGFREKYFCTDGRSNYTRKVYYEDGTVLRIRTQDLSLMTNHIIKDRNHIGLFYQLHMFETFEGNLFYEDDLLPYPLVQDLSNIEFIDLINDCDLFLEAIIDSKVSKVIQAIW